MLIFAAPKYGGTIAQLVEQRTENPCVPGSIPGGTTKSPEEYFGLFLLYQQVTTPYIAVVEASKDFKTSVGVNFAQVLYCNK